MISTHNVTWAIEPDDEGGRIVGNITCTAAKGSDCRLTCPAECESWSFDDHEHALVDLGTCGYLVWFDDVYADGVEHHYAGVPMPLRDGPVKLTYSEEEVTWDYLTEDPTLTPLEGLTP